MTVLLAVHIGAGLLALPAGTAAIAVRKGGPRHAQAGTLFALAMLVLGSTAALLEPSRTPPGSPVAGLFVCYFVLTSWVTARRRDGRAGAFEFVAGATALTTAGLMAWSAWSGTGRTPVGSGPIYAVATLCFWAGLGDLRAAWRRTLAPRQRIVRHVWRMCFAFFIATGSFFLGQQGVMPPVVHGSPILFLIAFAPFAVMAFWLVRLRPNGGWRRPDGTLQPAT